MPGLARFFPTEAMNSLESRSHDDQVCSACAFHPPRDTSHTSLRGLQRRMHIHPSKTTKMAAKSVTLVAKTVGRDRTLEPAHLDPLPDTSHSHFPIKLTQPPSKTCFMPRLSWPASWVSREYSTLWISGR